MNWSRGKILAWTDDAKGSSISMSEPSVRPIVAPSARSKAVPGSSPIAATTSRRGWTPAPRSGPWRLRRGTATGAAAGASATTLASSCSLRSRIELRATQSRKR